MKSFEVAVEDRFALVNLDAPDDMLPSFEVMRTFAATAKRLSARWDFLWDLRGAEGHVYWDVLEAYDASAAADQPWTVLVTPDHSDQITEAFRPRAVTVVPMHKKSVSSVAVDIRLLAADLDDAMRTLPAAARKPNFPRYPVEPFLRYPGQPYREALDELGFTDDEYARSAAIWSSPADTLLQFQEQFVPERERFVMDLRTTRLERFLQSIGRNSTLIELAIHVDRDRTTVVPCQAASLHEVHTRGDELILIRPGRAAARHWAAFADAIARLEGLLSEPRVREHEIERLLIETPLFLRGIGYTHVYPQVTLPRVGAKDLRPDVIAEPADSEWAEIVDLKLPSQRVLVDRDNRASLAAGITQAVSQLREYAAYFDDRRVAKAIEEHYGFRCYKPKLTVIVGREPTKFSPEERRRALTAHPGLRIVTYDDLLRAARRMLLL